MVEPNYKKGENSMGIGKFLVEAVKLVGRAGMAMAEAAANKAETAARTGSYNGHRLNDAQRAEMQARVDRYRESQARHEQKRCLEEMDEAVRSGFYNGERLSDGERSALQAKADRLREELERY